MFKEKKNRLKVIIGTLTLIVVFTGMYLGLNNVAFGLAADNHGSVDEADFVEMPAAAEEAVLAAEAAAEEEITAAEVAAQRALWEEEDAGLREKIRMEILEEQRLMQEGYRQPVAIGVVGDTEDLLEGEQWEHWEWTPLTEEEIEDRIDWIMLTTPRERHLSEARATELVIDWIYEEFGLVEDATASGQILSMWFEHEDFGIINRSFWTGSFNVFEVEEYGECGGAIFGELLENIVFALDGITGERVGIMDGMALSNPEAVEVRVGDMRINVSNNSTEFMAMQSPSFAVAPQPYHITAEDAAIRAAEMIYEQFQVNLDGLFMDLSLLTIDREHGLFTEWRVSVHNGRFDEERQTLFFLGIDAITGDLPEAIHDVRGVVGPGFNN